MRKKRRMSRQEPLPPPRPPLKLQWSQLGVEVEDLILMRKEVLQEEEEEREEGKESKEKSLLHLGVISSPLPRHQIIIVTLSPPR
jgi:hypothetical protein